LIKHNLALVSKTDCLLRIKYKQFVIIWLGLQNCSPAFFKPDMMGKSLHVVLFMLALCIVENTFGQNEAGYTWGNVKIGGGGFVTGIITTPSERNLIYARTDVGGAYRWHEDTQRWIPLLDWNSIGQTSYQGVESLAIDPSSPNRVYMSVGTDYWNNGISAILRSEDYGETFEISNVTSLFKVHANGMGRQTGERIAVDPNKGDVLFVGSRLGGLFRSENYGVSWTKVNSFPEVPTGQLLSTNGINAVVFDPESGNGGEPTQRIFVAVSRIGENNLFMTENGGETWTAVSGAINHLMVQRMIYANGHLFVTYTDKSGPWDVARTLGAVYKYNIAEGGWNNISPVANIPFSGISVDYNNPDVILVSTINLYDLQGWVTGRSVWGDRIYRSTNGGQTWVSLFGQGKFILDTSNLWENVMSMHWVGDLAIDPFNSDRVFAISGNGIFMTNNISNVETDKATWYLQCDGLEETVPLGLVSIPGGPLVSVIGDYDGFVHHDVNMVYKRHSPSIGSSTGVDFAQNNTSFVVRSGGDAQANLAFYSADQGTTWQPLTKPDGAAKSGHMAVSANGDRIIWKPDGVNETYFTSDLGQSWNPVNPVAMTWRPISDRVNNDVFYSYSGTSLRVFTFNSTQDNYSYTSVNIGSTGSNLIRPVPNREGEVWIANNNNGLRKYQKISNSVTKINSVSACRAVGFGKAPSGKTFPAIFIWGVVDGIEGIYRSDDEGDNWIRINDFKSQFGGPGNGNLVMGDANIFGRVYMSSVGRGIIMGNLENSTSVPELQLYNAFNDGRVFSGKLLINLHGDVASYQVFSLTGVLMEDGRSAGTLKVGCSLASGMYILRIEKESGVQTIKILKKE
jgi:xyloglucan-specific exo-beta-1,4-glucanase